MGVMDKIMGVMMGRMSKGEKDEMMDKMMEKFFADMTAEDKQKMMGEMMPNMMSGVNMMEMMPKMMMGMMGGGEGMGGMMSKMMGGGKEGKMPMMPQMMMGMMPQCLNMMLPNMPKGKRVDFILEMVTILVEQGSAGMSDNERKDFVAKMIEKVNA
jgi:hypothetical protein